MTLILSFDARKKMVCEAIQKEKEKLASDKTWYNCERERLKELSQKYDLEKIEKNNPFLILFVYTSLGDNTRYPEWIHKILDFYLAHALEEKSQEIESFYKDYIEKNQKKLDDFLALDVSEPRTNLDDYLKNEFYDFIGVTEEIQNAWDVNFDEFFYEEKDHRSEIIQKIFKVSPLEIKKGYTESPQHGGIVPMAFVFFEIYNGCFKGNVPELIPYVSHWHYLLERDFKDAHNGSKCEMLSKEVLKEPELFQKIRAIYALECKYKKENHRRQESIPFYLEW